MPRFAANLSFLFTEQPFLERFAGAARAGFDAVEFLTPYEFPATEIADAARAAGVEIVLFNAPPGDVRGDFGLAARPGREADLRMGVELALNYALALAVPRVHVLAGLGDPADAAAAAAYRSNLAYAAEKAAVQAVDILIEPLSARSRAGYFLRDFDVAQQVIADVGAPNLKLQFDIFHRQGLHGDVLAGLTELLPVIGHIQVASVPNRHEPGSGELADVRIFEALDALGYAGAIGAEYRPSTATTEESLGWFEPYRRR